MSRHIQTLGLLCGLLALAALAVYYDLVGYHLELGHPEQVQLVLDHVRYGTIDLSLFIRGFDVFYLLSVSPSELQQYFPRYGWAVYGLGLLFRYVFPTAFLLLSLRWLFGKRHRIHRIVQSYFKRLSLLGLFASTLAISLAAYFGFSDSELFFDFQLAFSKVFLLLNVSVALVVALLNKDRLFGWLKDFLFEPSSPYPLAITRMLFFTYLAVLYVLYYLQHGVTIGQLDKHPLPGIGWLIELLPVNSTIYSVVCWAGVLVTLMVAIGYRTRFFLIVNSLLVFYVVAAPNFFGKLWHEQIIIWISWILACSPCFEVLSLDSRSKRKSHVSRLRGNSYHLRIIWLQFGIIYFFAGFYKLWLCGFDWALSDSMINQVQIEWFEHYDKVSDWRLDKYPALLKLSGLAVIIFELFYGILLFHRYLRWVSVIGGLIMHNVLLKLIYIGFLLKLQVFYIVFIPWDKVLQKVVRPEMGEEAGSESPKLATWGVVVPAIVVGVNFIFGALNISSYPFSVYPVYAEIVPDNVCYFEYRVLDRGLEHLDFREEGRKGHFRWEDYSRAEYHVIRTWEAGLGLDSAAVRTQWDRWQLEVPKLADVDSVDVFVVERPLDPERAQERISEQYLMSVHLDRERGYY